MCCLLKRFMLIKKAEHVLSAEEVYVNKKGGNMCCLLKRFMLIRKGEHVLSAEGFMLIRKEETCVVC